MAFCIGVATVTVLLLCYAHAAAPISYFWPGQHAGSYGGSIPSYRGYYYFGRPSSRYTYPQALDVFLFCVEIFWISELYV